MTISRRDAFRVAADVLERSDWLTVDLLADLGDENASENADRIVEILREEAAEEDPIETPLEAATAAYLEASRQRDEALVSLRSLMTAYDAIRHLFITLTSTKDHRVAESLAAERKALTVPATAPPPSGAAGAPTYATGGYVGPVDGARIRDTLRAASDRAHALPAYARQTVTRPVSNGGPRTSGPLDPEIHAALVRSVERARRRDELCGIPECYCDGRSHP